MLSAHEIAIRNSTLPRSPTAQHPFPSSTPQNIGIENNVLLAGLAQMSRHLVVLVDAEFVVVFVSLADQI